MATNPAVIVDALKGISAKAASGSQGLGEVIGENMTLNPRRLAMALSHPSINELTVYHGSPHTFEKFDASKIGTGEGAQQYGHGIYVAESPDVAKKYKTANELTETLVNGKAIDPSDPRFQAAVRITTHGYEDALNGALRDASNEFLTPTGKQNQIKLAEQIKQLKDQNVSSRKTGSMYTVDLPDEHIDRMLDWHKPLGQQPKAIRDAINKTKELLPANAMSDLGNDLSVLYGKDVTPNEFLNTWEALTGSIGSGEAALQKNGIPGIKYFDAGSRDVGNGTRNFVIFPGEEHNLKILERK
jgi:hypothetical protein